MVQVQRLLSEMLQRRAPPTDTVGERPTAFVDLFSGIGGASEGAKAAGMTPVLAMDWDQEALDIHEHNNETCVHVCATFPMDVEAIPFPTDRPFLVHASPPCTRLSTMQMEINPEKKRQAVELVEWYLQTALRVSPNWWSMEQVDHFMIRDVLTRLRRSHPKHVDFVSIDLAELGVPQHRQRILAGPPHLVDKLRAYRSKERYVPASKALAATLPPEAAFLRNSITNRRVCARPKPTAFSAASLRKPEPTGLERAKPSASSRSIDKVAFVVVTTCALRICDARFKTLRIVSPKEMAALQGFPRGFKFPHSTTKKRMRRGLGNAISPIAIQVMLK